MTQSVAYTAHHPLPGGGVRVVGRRVAGVDGAAWHVRYDDGTDAADPEVAASTAELVAEAAAPPSPSNLSLRDGLLAETAGGLSEVRARVRAWLTNP